MLAGAATRAAAEEEEESRSRSIASPALVVIGAPEISEWRGEQVREWVSE
jgi:hypothetical protein